MVDSSTAGPRGGHASFEEPRGPGSAILDRELTGLRPLQRHVGHRDRAPGPSWTPMPTLADAPPEIPLDLDGVCRGARMVAPLRRRASGRCTFADRVREISRAREDVGAKAEPIAFGATACIAVTAVTKPAATVTEILASDIASSPESRLPVAARTPSPNSSGPACPTPCR
jgi:hypothetical protein